MNMRYRRHLTIAAGLWLIFAASAAAMPQEAPVSPPPSEVTPPQTPSETPTTGEIPVTSVTPETRVPYPAEARPISWSSLIFGFLVGGGVGYLIGRQSKPPEIQHDRAA
jgi:hypothetical protein